MILSLAIIVDTFFREDVKMLSIFSLLCGIIGYIVFMFFIIFIRAYTYSRSIYDSTKDYIYAFIIDITKEDYRDTKQD